jgi:hypothetical protein
VHDRPVTVGPNKGKFKGMLTAVALLVDVSCNNHLLGLSDNISMHGAATYRQSSFSCGKAASDIGPPKIGRLQWVSCQRP